MNLADLLIVYLAFGAPFAVYNYLHNRDTERGKRILGSVLTFLFWIPAAARTGYRYLTNAYSGRVFVSQRNLDTLDERLAILRESIKVELITAGCKLTVHDIRETLERYAGLAGCARHASHRKSDVFSHFLDAAGRTRHELATVCLTRRNRERVKRHHIQAGRDFAALFEHLSPPIARKATELGIEFANHLADHDTASWLGGLIEKRGEVWNAEHQKSAPSRISATVSPIAMTTASLNRD